MARKAGGRARGPAHPAAPGGLRRSRCSARSCCGCAGRWRTAGPARSATSCGWPSRRGTPRSRGRGRRRRRRTVPAAPPRPATRACGPQYAGGEAFLDRLSVGSRAPGRLDGRPRRPATDALDWPHAIAVAVCTAAAAGRGALVVLPDARDVARVDEALRAAGPRSEHVVLTADLGPEGALPGLAARRRAGRPGSWSGPGPRCSPRCTTSGLVVCWDDGDDLHAEPHAPYPHVREVLACGPGRTAPPRCSAGSSAPPRSSGWSGPAGPGRSRRRRGRAAARRRRGCCWPARGTNPSATPARRRPACPRSPGGRRPRPWRRPRCWSRCRAAATSRRWPARAAGRRRTAAPATGRWRCPTGRARRVCRWCGVSDAELGLPGVRRAPAALGRGGGPAHGGGAGPGVPRRAGGDQRRRRRGRRGAGPAGAGHRDAGCRAGRPTAGTARRCCSTRGRCWAAATCARGRRRCVAG